MSNSPSVLTSIRWNDVFPWLLLVRAARVALMVRVLALALVGVLLTQAGWSIVDRVLLKLPEGARMARLTDRTPPRLWATHEALQWRSAPASIDLDAMAATDGRLSQAIAQKLNAGGLFDAVDARRYAGPAVRGWAWAMQPFTRAIEAESWRTWFGFVIAGIWTIAVWAVIGGAVSRIAGLYLTRGETIGPVEAVRSMLGRWSSIAGAPAFCLLILALMAAMLAIAGVLIRLSVLALLIGVFWFLLTLGGAAIALVAVGLFLGWPMMWSAVAIDRSDSFDAISRSYSYTMFRPLALAFYLLVATGLGLASQAGVSVLADASLKATNWAVGGGAGHGRIQALVDGPTMVDGKTSLGVIDRWASKAIRFWSLGFVWVAATFPLAFLWPTAAAIYLLLRQSVDSTEITEIAVDDGAGMRGLPTLAPDPATGVPNVVGDNASPAHPPADAMR